MGWFAGIGNIFKRSAAGARPQPQEETSDPEKDYFTKCLRDKFNNGSTTRKIIETLHNLQLPIPKKEKEFLNATEGALIFSTYYGVVIRIEQKQPSFTLDIKRVNNNPWVIQPLGTFDAGKAVIEICPGCHTTDDERTSNKLYADLQDTGIRFWDDGARNIGILPFKTPSFPKGVPVVIDRLAVSGLSESLKQIKEALEKIGHPQDPQKQLYAPLRDALKNAWPDLKKDPDPDKMKLFWQMCRQYAEEGKLVAGWTTDRNPKNRKQYTAKTAATHFDRKIKTAQLATDSTAPKTTPAPPA